METNTEATGGASVRLPARVLVADDNALIRQLLEAQLAELGCEVESVEDGEAAVAAWAAGRADAVILDLAMPRLDGTEAARRIRELSAESARPWIVGLSAHAGDGDRERGLRAGMNRFLTKPTDLARLAAALRGGDAAPSSSSVVVAGSAVGGAGGLGAGQLAALWAAFREETPGVVEALAAAVERPDLVETGARAHYLKSTALVMGAPDLAAACRACEEAARAGRADEARRRAGEAVAEARRLLAETEVGGAGRRV